MKKHTGKPALGKLWKNHRELCEYVRSVANDTNAMPRTMAEEVTRPVRMETELVKALADENKRLREQLKLAGILMMLV